MKKSLITLAVSSIFLLSACNDKEKADLTQQVQQDKQTISQLQTELAQLKAENQRILPAIQAEKTVLFKKEETLTFPKSKNDDEYAISEAQISYDISTVTTKIQWLDDLLLQRISQYFLAENEKLPAGEPKQALQNLITQSYNSDLNTLKERETIGIENSVNVNYIGQRNHLITFSVTNYLFAGGAHGVGSIDYLNIDSSTKKILTLDDIIGQANRSKLKELLWTAYVERSKSNGEQETYVSKSDFNVSDRFYFSAEGLNFTYPPYDIGAYAEGDITLTLSWYELKNVLNKEYFW